MKRITVKQLMLAVVAVFFIAVAAFGCESQRNSKMVQYYRSLEILPTTNGSYAVVDSRNNEIVMYYKGDEE